MLPPGAPPPAPPALPALSWGQEESLGGDQGQGEDSSRCWSRAAAGQERATRPGRPLHLAAASGRRQRAAAPSGTAAALPGRAPLAASARLRQRAGSGAERSGAEEGRGDRLHRAWKKISFQVAAPLHQSCLPAPGVHALWTVASI